MNSFPFESKNTGTSSRPVWDRAITAEMERQFNMCCWTNGVFATPTTGLMVEAVSGMTVKVNKGGCHINGARAYLDADLNVTLSASNPSYDRYDRIVARFDNSEEVRSIDIYTKEGTASRNPVVPALTRQPEYYEICLATIRVVAGTTNITNSYITDTRLNDNLCGLVVPAIPYEESTQQLWKQISDSIDLVNSAISGTVAGDLQAQITADNNIVNANNFTGAESSRGWTMLGEGADLNSITNVGIYYVNSDARAQSLLNCPVNSIFKMTVEAVTNGTNWKHQTIYVGSVVSQLNVYRRATGNGGQTWGDWIPMNVSAKLITDCNTATYGGVYRYNQGTENAPTARGGILFAMRYTSDYIYQICTPFNVNAGGLPTLWVRQYNTATDPAWGEWKCVSDREFFGGYMPTIPANADLNSYVDGGIWRCAVVADASTLVNSPTGKTGLLRVIQMSTNYSLQEWRDIASNDIYERRIYTSSGGTVTPTAWKKVVTAENDVVDYVTDQGTTGNWNWRKWNSGRCELWGKFTQTVTSDASALFILGSSSVTPYPFAITNPMIQATCQKIGTGVGYISSLYEEADYWKGIAVKLGGQPSTSEEIKWYLRIDAQLAPTRGAVKSGASSEELMGMKKDDLIDMAEGEGIEVQSSMTKGEVVDAIVSEQEWIIPPLHMDEEPVLIDEPYYEEEKDDMPPAVDSFGETTEVNER